MKKIWILLGVIVLGALPATSSAAINAQGWSMLSGQTVGAGQTAVMGQVGYPGLSGTLMYGSTSTTDIGARFSFDYGGDGTWYYGGVGIKLQGILKLGLLETSKYNFALQFEPGPFFSFNGYGTQVGLTMPVKFIFGIPIGSAVMFNLGMDVPLSITFGDNNGLYQGYGGTGFLVGFLFGGGLEYFVDRHLSVNFNMRVGPVVEVAPYGAAGVGLEALLGVAYRL